MRQVLVLGDSVYFERGGVWREQLNISSSGNSDDLIVFGAYGEGEKPVISGSDVISDWTLYDPDKNIYVADVSLEVNQVFMDGVIQTLSRWPNSGWQTIDADSEDKTQLYSESLTQEDDYWEGALIYINSCPWKIEGKTIVSNSQSEKTISWEGDVYQILAGYKFYIEGKLEEIDSPGEWFYGDGKLYLQLEAGDIPLNHQIEASVRDYGIGNVYPYEQGNHITIQDLNVQHAKGSGIKILSADDITIQNNDISYNGARGVFLTSYYYDRGNPHYNLLVSNNVISHCGIDGITIGGDHNEVSILNNTIRDIGSLLSPKGKSHGIMISGENSLVSGNKISNTIYDGIFVGFYKGVISDNIIFNCVLSLSDGGGIYTSGSRDLIIENNRVSDLGSGARGIYLDENSSGVTVQKNIVKNSYYGMHLHRAYNNTILNNVLYNNRYGVMFQERNVDEMHDNNFYNNIFLSADVDQLAMYVGRNSGSSLEPVGDFDHNLYYNPFNEINIKIYRAWNDITEYELDAWKTSSGQDQNSVSDDPLFVNVFNDFHLQLGSPAIDAGMEVGLTSDIENNLIPQGEAPDIGAFESRDEPPILYEVTPISTPTYDNTPDYTFNTNEAGVITYGGDCASEIISARIGNNTITFFNLSPGTYSNCTIRITDTAGNISSVLNITQFTISSNSGSGINDGGGDDEDGGSGSSFINPINTEEDSDILKNAPSNFIYSLADNQLKLLWLNPSDSDFFKIRLIKKIDSAINGINDPSADIIYEGSDQSYVDIDFNDRNKNYYGLFAFNEEQGYSKMLTLEVPVELSDDKQSSQKQTQIEIKKINIDNLYNQAQEIVEQVSFNEAEIIFKYNNFIPLDDTTLPVYKKLVLERDFGSLEDDVKYSIAYFIHYGTPTTLRLGAGERAGVINSFWEAFQKAPITVEDWQDIIKIANGRWPKQSNTGKEELSKQNYFKKIYKKDPNMDNANENAAVTIITYGLRPVNRNMESEKVAIKTFEAIYKYSPTNASDWDVVRAVAYSGAVR